MLYHLEMLKLTMMHSLGFGPWQHHYKHCGSAGSLPEAWGHMPWRIFAVGNNKLRGTIPASYATGSNWADVIGCEFANNYFTGMCKLPICLL